MNFEADPSPLSRRMRANHGKTFVLADQGEGVAKRLFILRLEGIRLGMEARLQILQKPRKIAFAFVGRELAPQLCEDALQLHRVRHVALDLELAGHERRHTVELTRGH